MNKDKSVHVATGVWYELSFGHTAYRHFPCNMQYDIFRTNNHKYISALESCEPITERNWGAGYNKLNGAKPRTIKELIDLAQNVCADFLASAEYFAETNLPMISMSMERLITGATCYQGRTGHMEIDYGNDNKYDFIYSGVNSLVTPSNISDILGKQIKHIHVIERGAISWDQQSKLDPNASLYVYNYDKYEAGGVYVKVLHPDTEIVNKNLCLIGPKQTKRIPSQMAEFFKQKTAPIMRSAQSRNR